MKKMFFIVLAACVLVVGTAAAYDVFYGQHVGLAKQTGDFQAGYRSEHGKHGLWHYGVFYADAENSEGIFVVRLLLGVPVAFDYFKAGGGFSEPIAFDSIVGTVECSADTFTWRAHRYTVQR